MFRLLRTIRRLICLAIFAIVLLLLFFLWQGIRSRGEIPSADDRATSASVAGYTAYNPSRMHAMWVSQFDLAPILLEDGVQREESDFRKRAERVMGNIASCGINTVFLQVRPNGDSFYPSALFPSSHYATGAIGADFAYDPFTILLDLAHREGLSVHAWINPLRLYTEGNRKRISEEYVHATWCEEESDRAVLVDGVWYLNPAYPEARELISDGVREILSNYDVDGIHIDDYFYPTVSSDFDREAYAAYGKKRSLADFRRDAISATVKELYKTVHLAEGERIFGVSPTGNNQRNYEELFADVGTWCAQKGYLDYLCPQVYFGLEHETHPFEKVAREFSDLIRADGIRLCIGMTLGKAYNGYYGREDPYAGSGATEWIDERDILVRSADRTEELLRCDGFAFFSYQYFFSPENGARIEATREEQEALIPLLKEKLGDEKNF